MKKLIQYAIVTSVIILAAFSQAKIIVVNTVDNTNFNPGVTNLVTAINLLTNGDAINFNISGLGAHYIVTPVGGYPIITNLTGITIDGYSQPGSSPNTHSILASNNANITIVLDSSNGEITDLTGINGYSQEGGLLSVLGCTNVNIRGLCFLAITPIATMNGIANNGDNMYAIAMGGGEPTANVHIQGCRFGLDLDNTTVMQFYKNITEYGASASGDCFVGVITNSPNPVAEFNVFIGGYIVMEIELNGQLHLSGNFINVYPDGLHDFNVDGLTHGQVDHIAEALIEFGSPGTNSVIGTDGDGVNDAEERNIFGGVTEADDSNVWECYGSGPQMLRVCGNYWGVGVDGVTRFSNGGPDMEWLDIGGRSASTMQVGSDFDGVSDALEANLLYWNNPFATLYGTPPVPGPGPNADYWAFMVGPDNNAAWTGYISLRGNIMVNNQIAPFTYADGTGGPLEQGFFPYMSPFVDTSTASLPSDLIAQLSATNIFPHLQGTFPPGIGVWTNIIIDVYQLDPEGWTNGQEFALTELTDYATYTNGFPQGKKYIGSFPVPNTGSFNITLSDDVDLGSGAVTVTANYSADPPGTHNGRVHTGNFSNPGYLIPGSAESVGLTHVVPDQIVWYNTNSSIESEILGNCIPSDEAADNSNWEGYTAVLSDSLFLISWGAFTTPYYPQPAGTGGSSSAPPTQYTNQNWVVVKQPADGGAAALDWSYYSDYQHGTPVPVKGVINLSRDNGNPPRVAADLRYGANTILTMNEASLGQISQFQSSDNRWANNPIYKGINRYVCEQLFNLNGLPGSLAVTPVTNAWDYVYGATVAATLPTGNNAPQCSRTGGRANFLDNGNIVVMIDDKTCLLSTVGEVTTFSIITPQGNIIKGPTLADAHDIWDNMCAFKGGFMIRVHNLLHFYDDNGNELAFSPVDSNVTSGLSYGPTGGARNDASRVASDIRGYYVYLAGQSPEPSYSGHLPSGTVYLSAWDSRTGNFLSSIQVDDGQPGLVVNDRVAVGVDDLDRVCVAWSFQPDYNVFTNRQVAARMFQFTGAQFTPQTHSFFAFINHDSNPDNVLGFETYHPSVAMTRRQICISAKGKLNTANNPAAGPNVVPGDEVKVYTVISQPVPVAAPQPSITVSRSGSNLNVTWDVNDGFFTVQTTPQVKPSGTVWTDFTTGNVAPPVSVPHTAANQYVRLIRRY
ncbi:MAG: hypothetical protein ACLQU3_12365 [Limisphaerales bacterium]